MNTLLNILSSARLALVCSWLMVGGIAYSLAGGLTYLLGEAGTLSNAPSAPPASPAATRGAVDVESIIARNLFGAADPTAARALAAAQPAVETRLPLDLLAVFVGEHGAASAAIVAERGKPGLLYAMGAEIPGGASLQEVHPDHVILARAGNPETLFFPRPGQGATAGSSALELPADPGLADMAADVETYYDEPAPEPDAEPPAFEYPPMSDFQQEVRDQTDPSEAQ